MSYNSILENEVVKVNKGLLFCILWGLHVIVLIQYLSLVALLSYFFNRFGKKSFSTKSVDIIQIWLKNNTISSLILYILKHKYTSSQVPLTESIEISSLLLMRIFLYFHSGERLMNTTLSIFKMLILWLIILDLNGDHIIKFLIFIVY